MRKPQFGENPTGPVENAEPGNPEWKQQEAQGPREKRALDPKSSAKDLRRQIGSLCEKALGGINMFIRMIFLSEQKTP